MRDDQKQEGDWLTTKCPRCTERAECLSEKNEKLFDHRMELTDKLGFCEDYVVDNSQFKTDRHQVCHEETTFEDLYNKGEFPIYED